MNKRLGISLIILVSSVLSSHLYAMDPHSCRHWISFIGLQFRISLAGQTNAPLKHHFQETLRSMEEAMTNETGNAQAALPPPEQAHRPAARENFDPGDDAEEATAQSTSDDFSLESLLAELEQMVDTDFSHTNAHAALSPVYRRMLAERIYISQPNTMAVLISEDVVDPQVQILALEIWMRKIDLQSDLDDFPHDLVELREIAKIFRMEPEDALKKAQQGFLLDTRVGHYRILREILDSMAEERLDITREDLMIQLEHNYRQHRWKPDCFGRLLFNFLSVADPLIEINSMSALRRFMHGSQSEG